ncbi:HD domain-containing protein [Cytophagaceae bacterium DM2B3-1]|uniref:HD domain-containing protein n=1 Tax=Xanthocytophaga flava TaxID=3048013 RepID=A0ABT7CCY3_9BACT|nr:HD domain-containing protein [Xanthocytophaga flavus]MDJ1470621.1 HD domain-containing protein [Xanthocytophaga flavus]MDJ1491536.1 HD domain-containing protein [Xanthocytophaga flavus]
MLTHDLGRQVFGNPANAGNTISLQDANQLLDDWVKNESLKRHMRQVAALMKAWAREVEKLDDVGQLKWETAGLLHDADWDQWPDDHCKRIVEELEKRDIDPEIIHAIASHGPRFFGVEPVTTMDKMLYAFDELSGFIHAYSLMRPTGYEGMDVKGVRKRLKDKAFAAQVSREDIADAAQRAAREVDELIAFAITHQAGV